MYLCHVPRWIPEGELLPPRRGLRSRRTWRDGSSGRTGVLRTRSEPTTFSLYIRAVSPGDLPDCDQPLSPCFYTNYLLTRGPLLPSASSDSLIYKTKRSQREISRSVTSSSVLTSIFHSFSSSTVQTPEQIAGLGAGSP